MMLNTRMFFTLILVCGLLPLTVVSQSRSQEEKPNDADALAKTRADEAIKLAQKHAAQYDMYADQDRETRLVLYDKPVLRWTNPVPEETGAPSAEVYGGVFVWTLGKRPHVVASIFKWYSPHKHVAHEFVSLSPRRIIAERDSETQWHPSSAGIALKVIPQAPPPADSPRGRALQIRTMGRQFTSEKIDQVGNRTSLRLLTKPLYEYECSQPDVIGGALLAFVEGTDPEIVLLIEVRKSGDEFKWHYAAGRLNHLRLRLYHREQEVWSQPFVPYAKRSDRSATYAYIHRRAGN